MSIAYFEERTRLEARGDRHPILVRQMARSPVFERPSDRAGELRGTAGAVRFLELPPRRFVSRETRQPSAKSVT
jgi:hypothetical protein